MLTVKFFIYFFDFFIYWTCAAFLHFSADLNNSSSRLLFFRIPKLFEYIIIKATSIAKIFCAVMVRCTRRDYLNVFTVVVVARFAKSLEPIQAKLSLKLILINIKLQIWCVWDQLTLVYSLYNVVSSSNIGKCITYI